MKKISKSKIYNLFNKQKNFQQRLNIFDNILISLHKEPYTFMIYGGSVRDLFLNKDIDDIDIKTNLDLEMLKESLSNFNERKMIGKNEEIIYGKLNKSFIEISNFLNTSEEYDKKNLLREVELSDLTLNHIYYDGEYFYDLSNGIKDILNRKLKMADEEIFKNNILIRPLILLKTYRLIAKTEFEPDEKLLEILFESKSHLKDINKGIKVNEGIKNLSYDGFPLLLKYLIKTEILKSKTEININERITMPAFIKNKDALMLSNYWILKVGKEVVMKYLDLYDFDKEFKKNVLEFHDIYLKNKSKKLNLNSKANMQIYLLKKAETES